MCKNNERLRALMERNDKAAAEMAKRDDAHSAAYGRLCLRVLAETNLWAEDERRRKTQPDAIMSAMATFTTSGLAAIIATVMAENPEYGAELLEQTIQHFPRALMDAIRTQSDVVIELDERKVPDVH